MKRPKQRHKAIGKAPHNGGHGGSGSRESNPILAPNVPFVNWQANWNLPDQPPGTATGQLKATSSTITKVMIAALKTIPQGASEWLNQVVFDVGWKAAPARQDAFRPRRRHPGPVR